MKKIGLIILALAMLSACAGRHQYTPPIGPLVLDNSVTINRNKQDVWKSIVPALGKSFFVINNLDKESGIINVSYSGDPEKYIDCGNIMSYVKNARGERTYNFPAARAHQTFEIMDMDQGGVLLFLDRKVNLEGRINIIIEEISSDKCLISINTKYVLSKSTSTTNMQGVSDHVSDTISFVSGQRTSFPGGGSHSGTLCQATGKLEQEVLSIILPETK